MFGIDFAELVVCGVVALIVVGPQRLPEVVRNTALWIGRFKRSIRETKETIERQIGVDDIRRQLHTEEMMRTLDDMKEEIETALNYERMGNKPVLKQDISTEAAEVPDQLASPEMVLSDLENNPVLPLVENSSSPIVLEKITSAESVLPEKQTSSSLLH